MIWAKEVEVLARLPRHSIARPPFFVWFPLIPPHAERGWASVEALLGFRLDHITIKRPTSCRTLDETKL